MVAVLGIMLSFGLIYIYLYIPCPPRPSKQHSVDVCENWSQLFSHCQQKQVLSVLYNKIIKMTSSFWSHQNVLETAVNHSDGSEVSCSSDVCPGALMGMSLRRTGHVGAPEGCVTFMAILRGSAACSRGGNVLYPLGFMGLLEQEPSPNSLAPFVGWWFGEDGGMREERSCLACWCPLDCSGKFKIRLWGMRNILTGHIWIFPDYRLSPLAECEDLGCFRSSCA